MVNGVLTIPLSGISFGSSQAADARAIRLSQFVAGPENALVAAALGPFLDSRATCYSPLVLCGPHGSGKSHLACGLADWWRRHFPDASLVCLTGSEFAREHTAAMAEGRLEAWRAEVRGAGLFVLDDLGELVDKRSAQRELLHALDALSDSGGLVVVTARTLPGHWPVLLPALGGRLSAGLAVSLAFPARPARRVLLQQLAAGRGVSLRPEALDGLAAGLEGGVPTLISAILELELAACAQGQSIDSERVRQFVSERDGAAKPTLRQIAGLTAKYFGLKVSELKGPARRRSLAAGRGVAMYLARQLTNSSLGQIGSYFGGRDHTTVLYGCRRTEKLLHRDRATRQAVTELKKLLASS
ncbi:MAG: helix-turn-helix domain-containing protein [Pirellulales bacterium]